MKIYKQPIVEINIVDAAPFCAGSGETRAVFGGDDKYLHSSWINEQQECPQLITDDPGTINSRTNRSLWDE